MDASNTYFDRTNSRHVYNHVIFLYGYAYICSNNQGDTYFKYNIWDKDWIRTFKACNNPHKNDIWLNTCQNGKEIIWLRILIYYYIIVCRKAVKVCMILQVLKNTRFHLCKHYFTTSTSIPYIWYINTLQDNDHSENIDCT